MKSLCYILNFFKTEKIEHQYFKIPSFQSFSHKFYYCVFFSFLLAEINYSQDGWFCQSPIPTKNYLNDVCFINKDIGIAVGEAGTILRTTDGGNTWNNQSIENSFNLTGVWFNDTNNGVIIGYTYSSGNLKG